MKSNKKCILILDGNSTQILPIIRSFYRSGHKISIVSPHWICAGSFSRYKHAQLIWPDLYKNDHDTLNRIIQYLENNSTDLILGLSDKTAGLLSKNLEKLKQYTRVITPSYKIFNIAADKYKTMSFCMENSIPCPLTLDGGSADIDNIEHAISFPIIVKPKTGVGSVGVRKYTCSDVFKKEYIRLQETYGSLIIQEYIPNEEQYTVEAVCDNKSKVKACVIIAKTRYFPVSGGTSSCSVSVRNPEIESVVVRFLEELKWIGNANLDVIFDRRDNTPKIIEINPRVGAMVRLAFESGIDIAEMQYQLAFEEQVQEVKCYRENLILRNLLLEFSWLFSSSVMKWRRSKPSFFAFFGRDVFYENFRIDDPFTGLGYLLSNVRKYMNLKSFRQKFSGRS